MPRKRRNKKKSQVSSVEQQEGEIEGNHEHPMSHSVSSSCEVTAQSRDAVSTTSLVGRQTCPSFVAQLISQHNSPGATNVVSFDQSLLHRTRSGKCWKGKKPAQVSLMTPLPTPADDTTLLNIIGSVDHDRAVELLKGNHSVSQEGLDKALLSACQRGHKYIAQRLAGIGANVNYKDSHGNTPLLISAENGFTDIVRTLIMRKADINVCNSDGDTALILSIRSSGSTDMVTVLLAQEGININHQNRAGHTALMKAMEVKDIDTMKMLMDKYNKQKVQGRPDLFTLPLELKEIKESKRYGLESIFQLFERCTNIRTSALLESMKTSDTESFNVLLDCQRVDTDESKRNVDQAFKKMFDTREIDEVKTFTDIDIAMIKKLLECGADMNVHHHSRSNHLSVAVMAGNYGLVDLLCKHLDQLKQWPYNFGKNALKTAATIGRCDLVELLLRYTSDIINDYFDDSPLNCALTRGHVDCAKLLIRLGAKMDIVRALDSAVACPLPNYLNFLFENYKQEIQNHVLKNSAHVNKLLISAIKGDNLEIMSHILDAGADVNNENSAGETPIVESNNGEVAAFLVSRGANVNYLSRSGNTPLINIIMNKYRYNRLDTSKIEIVQVLLDNEALVNRKGENGRTPLMVTALTSGNVTLLQMLFDHGANVSDKDQTGQTALMHAVCAGHTQNVSCLLKFTKEKDLINLQNLKGLTALMRAVIDMNLNVVQKLIEHGADVNIKDVEGNNALLHALSQVSKIEPNFVTALIKAGSDVNYQNNAGFSPLMLAAKSRDRQSILILLDSGADVNAVSRMDNTKTALSVLANNSRFDGDIMLCIEELLDRGASSSYIDQGFLHKMIVQDKIQIIPKLIRCGLGPADVTPDRALQKFNITTPVSPLCVSLLVGNVHLSRYFEDILFMTSSDVSSLTCNKTVRNILEQKKLQECLNFLDDLSTQPWSLFKLALVSVSSAVGTSPGRENRVNILPLPQVMKHKLLFKSNDIKLHISGTQTAAVTRTPIIDLASFIYEMSASYDVSDDDGLSDLDCDFDYDCYDYDTD